MVAVLYEAGRGHVDDLATARPIGLQLPAAFHEDDFCQRFTSALDEVLAPIFTTLDCFDSYLDPLLAPADFVDWLAGWVGVEVDENWPIERRRRLAVGAVNLYRMRGTVAGLTEHILLYCGLEPEIEESGACTWSPTAGGTLPGSAIPALTVRVRVPRGEEVNRSTVRRIVEQSRPAHLPCTVEVTGSASRRSGEQAGTERTVDAPMATGQPASEQAARERAAPEQGTTEQTGADQSGTGQLGRGQAGTGQEPTEEE